MLRWTGGSRTRVNAGATTTHRRSRHSHLRAITSLVSSHPAASSREAPSPLCQRVMDGPGAGSSTAGRGEVALCPLSREKDSDSTLEDCGPRKRGRSPTAADATNYFDFICGPTNPRHPYSGTNTNGGGVRSSHDLCSLEWAVKKPPGPRPIHRQSLHHGGTTQSSSSHEHPSQRPQPPLLPPHCTTSTTCSISKAKPSSVGDEGQLSLGRQAARIESTEAASTPLELGSGFSDVSHSHDPHHACTEQIVNNRTAHTEQQRQDRWPPSPTHYYSSRIDPYPYPPLSLTFYPSPARWSGGYAALDLLEEGEQRHHVLRSAVHDGDPSLQQLPPQLCWWSASPSPLHRRSEAELGPSWVPLYGGQMLPAHHQRCRGLLRPSVWNGVDVDVGVDSSHAGSCLSSRVEVLR